MPVYSPLTGEEAVAKKQEESKKLQDSEKATVSDVQIEKLVLSDKTDGEIKEDLALNKLISVQESTESLDAKKLQDNEKIVAADPPACVGQVNQFRSEVVGFYSLVSKLAYLALFTKEVFHNTSTEI